ncbi:MAG TPA: hypothetical protein VJK54_08625 [Chthoniobacterales bacterium]|nr:hypothetical protein [Chthoniobacterales bacterium]
MKKNLSPKHNGSRLVLIIVILGCLGSGLTVWNYSRGVFSTTHATVINSSGTIEALFPMGLAKKVHPGQIARITFEKSRASSTTPFSAKVVSTTKTTMTTKFSKPMLLVTLRLIEDLKPIEYPVGLVIEEPCSVTIDTTILPR